MIAHRDCLGGGFKPADEIVAASSRSYIPAPSAIAKISCCALAIAYALRAVICCCTSFNSVLSAGVEWSMVCSGRHLARFISSAPPAPGKSRVSVAFT